MATVTIDLSLDDNSFKKSYDALFHKEKYDQLGKIIQSRLNFVEANKDDSENVNHNRSHQAVLLNGERGTGKTSILVNLKSFMKKKFENIEKEILFLDPVDPTLLNNNEDFLNVVIAQINKNKVIQEQLEKIKNSDYYYHSLEMLANALEGEQTAKNQTGLDKLLSYQGSLDITQRTHEYFHEVLKFTDKKLIVIAIDDVDMSLYHGFEILEVVRKYLCSNYVLPIVSGDLTLYKELVHNEFFKQLVHKDSNQNELQKKQAFNLTKEYLRKVFPLHQRIYVPTIEQYCEKASLGQNVEIKNGENPIFSLYEFHQWFLIVLNGRVNGEENSIVSYTPKTVRELMQLLGALKPIFTEERFSNLTEFCKLRHQIDDKKLDIKNVLTTSLLSKKKDNERKNINELFDIISDHFKVERPDLHYLCEALKVINNVGNLFLNDLIYFNPIKQLEIGKIEIIEKRNNENFEFYKNFGEQKQYLPRNLTIDNEVYFLRALPAIEPACNPLQLLARNNNDNSRLFYEYIDKSPENLFLLKLFSHANYYTSYQNKPFIFFGKFFEIITISLMKDIDVKWVQNLLLKPPYFSIIDVNPTKVFDFSLGDTLQEESEAELEEDTEELEFLKSLVDLINEFRKNNIHKDGAEFSFIDVSLFAAIQSKYFNQLNLYKNNNSRLFKKNFDAKDLLQDAAIRAAYCYWSALGSFEKRESLFNSSLNGKIAHQNFFSTSTMATNKVDDLRKYNNTYKLNVLPFIGEEIEFKIPAFTKLLKKHPIFEIINRIVVSIKEDPADKIASIEPLKKETFVANYSRPYIEKIFNEKLTENEYQEIFQYNEPSRKKEFISDKIKQLLDVVNSKTDESNYPFIPFIKSAQFGSMFKTRVANGFKTSSDVERLLNLIWLFIFDKNQQTVKNSKLFIQKLTDIGIDEKLASLLSTGIR